MAEEPLRRPAGTAGRGRRVQPPRWELMDSGTDAGTGSRAAGDSRSRRGYHWGVRRRRRGAHGEGIWLIAHVGEPPGLRRARRTGTPRRSLGRRPRERLDRLASRLDARGHGTRVGGDGRRATRATATRPRRVVSWRRGRLQGPRADRLAAARPPGLARAVLPGARHRRRSPRPPPSWWTSRRGRGSEPSLA